MIKRSNNNRRPRSKIKNQRLALSNPIKKPFHRMVRVIIRQTIRIHLLIWLIQTTISNDLKSCSPGGPMINKLSIGVSSSIQIHSIKALTNKWKIKKYYRKTPINRTPGGHLMRVEHHSLHSMRPLNFGATSPASGSLAGNIRITMISMVMTKKTSAEKEKVPRMRKTGMENKKKRSPR